MIPEQTYICGNCGGDVRLSTVKCSDGSLHQAYKCKRCAETWFTWQLMRDIEWQRREDERRERQRAARRTTESEAR